MRKKLPSGHADIAVIAAIGQTVEMAPSLNFQERLPVWTALSELCLDTSFDDADYDRIAAVLLKSPYRPADIEWILRHELLPVFAPNLLSVAGRWSPWPEEQVSELMGRWLDRQAQGGWVARVWERWAAKRLPLDWGPVAARLNDG